MNDYITKPIDVDQLYKTLLKWIKPEQIKVTKKQPKQPIKMRNNKLSVEVELPRITGINIAEGLKRVSGIQRIDLSRNTVISLETESLSLSLYR